MKKICFVVLVLIVALSIVSCESGGGKTDVPIPTSNVPTLLTSSGISLSLDEAKKKYTDECVNFTLPPNYSREDLQRVRECNNIDVFITQGPDEAKQKYVEKCANLSPNINSQVDVANKMYCDSLEIISIQSADEARQKYAEKCANLPTPNSGSFSQLEMMNQMYCANLKARMEKP